MGYFQLRLFKRLLTYSRPMKYPTASCTPNPEAETVSHYVKLCYASQP